MKEPELNLPTFVAQTYLADLSDDDLFIRPHEKANHIAWQLGHLITSEYNLLTGYLLHIGDSSLKDLLVAKRFTNTHIQGDLGDTRDLHRRLVGELLLQFTSYIVAIKLF